VVHYLHLAAGVPGPLLPDVPREHRRSSAPSPATCPAGTVTGRPAVQNTTTQTMSVTSASTTG
jgi:hypothetical protein